ncbi:hypothetical protein [Stenotrophomonas sp. MMGLT7]|uniref:hypothetical protein n=1 Tax=Stenotrophomonas sp. MMGLT7 TaxID=2901227 RepID=UPI001E540C43|nr:hypothetical protein [Stenotrophomonas sp. MMGLT7]MCD7096914.1 hypothetical protein [Stenotrophomonas sp. MMGLT7]
MPNYRPPRSQVIGTLIQQAVLELRLQWNAYAAAVVEHYHDTVAMEDCIVEFHVACTSDQHEHATRMNTQTVRRLLSGEIRMPVDIEDSLIAALPPAAGERVARVLLERNGLLFARQPAGGAGGAFVGPCDLMRHVADVIQPLAQALADGAIEPHELPLCRLAAQELEKLMGVCITLQAQLKAATGLREARA